LPRLGEVPAYRLTERSGRTVEGKDLLGSVTVYDFIFTHCAGTCPVMTLQMERIQKRWGAQGVRLVSVTVDPARDTVPRLARYAKESGAGEGWLFLTGAQEEVLRLAVAGFKLPASENPEPAPGDEFIHSTRFVLVDPSGGIRGYYEGVDEEGLKALHRDIGKLLKER
jgi:cytochrome oxidase Cu insertion factor (SCO1/SenC/PrrC family)